MSSRQQRIWQLITGELRRLIADPVNRGSAVVFAGSVARLALGFVASVLIARTLGPANFGVYAVLAATVGIAGAIADLGLTSAAVKRIASTRPSVPTEAQVRGRAFFWTKIMAATLVTAFGLLLAGPLARHVLGLAGAVSLLRLAFLGIVATALSGSVSGILQATERFGRLSVVLITNSGLTALLAAGLATTGRLNLVTALVVLGIGTSLGSFAVGYRLLPAGWNFGLPARFRLREEAGHLLRFGRWLWIAAMFEMLTAQLDVLLVNRWGAATTVGVYALALNLATKVDVVNHSLYTVLMPAASALESRHAMRDYVRRGVIRSALISLGLLPLFLLAHPFILLFYGPDFAPAVPVFRLLLGVVLVDVFATPLLLLAFPLEQPQALAAADALRAGTLTLIAAWLIPIWGPTGAVAAKFMAKVAGAGLTLVWLWRRYSAGEVAVQRR